MKISKLLKMATVGVLSLSIIAGCSSKQEASSSNSVDYNKLSVEEITKKAKEEGQLNSVGMPDAWANWKGTWEDLQTKYGIKHSDTDMSSAEELAKFESEKDNATADIGDVGIAFGPLAKEKDLTLAYKTSHWDDIPKWAKDNDGHWVLGYTGSIAFITDKNNVKNSPKSWKDLESGNYKVTVGDVLKANQAQFAVLAAAYANGGNEKNIQPGIDFFNKLAKQGRLRTTDPSLTALEKGEVDVAIVWDFNALGYRDQIDKNRFDIVIPQDGSVMSGYTTVINKYAKHPYAAMLAREYILSDEGQANLARGYARPIRENVKLPEDAKAKLLPNEMYKNVHPVSDMKTWEETTKKLMQLWQEQVLTNVK
ncbi:extracellular solute-binding protein [Paenibacillus sediminis]|uniref:Spermidine/putrescine transport system substrate-binding protein n=1 Tax=Paenibacillus sediminis TaxID=664909 RepID=A0ABS4H2S3_9BACL|nr:extracellular solute-binding protein [Paenibacillus sediminis]MBP1936838.1 putative spermidine/putrescine transport system substrate-binding protein [Paenibacillus sediminis]